MFRTFVSTTRISMQASTLINTYVYVYNTLFALKFHEIEIQFPSTGEGKSISLDLRPWQISIIMGQCTVEVFVSTILTIAEALLFFRNVDFSLFLRLCMHIFSCKTRPLQRVICRDKFRVNFWKINFFEKHSKPMYIELILWYWKYTINIYIYILLKSNIEQYNSNYFINYKKLSEKTRYVRQHFVGLFLEEEGSKNRIKNKS